MPHQQAMKTNLKKAQKEFVQDLYDRKKSSLTASAYTKDLDQLIKYLFNCGVTAVEEVSSRHLEEFLQNLYDAKKLSPKSVSRKINSIKSFANFLVTRNYLTNNLAKDIKHPKLITKAPKIFSKTECLALREVARKDPKTLTMIELMLQTGIRISELAGLEVSHLSLGRPATLFVPQRESQKERVIPLNTKAKEALQKFIDTERQVNSAFLFTTRSGKAILIRNIRSSMERLFKRAGLKGSKVNDFRHTFTGHQLAMGVSLQTICRVAGHKTLTTTEKYLKYMKIKKPGIKEVLEEI
ncbi:hypothetical protein COT50_01530 [candidate division WWE3 bacterium CG08_land_8_20_14_0_20_41_10]|uniref:Integrase n=1 Tax=candidate division WWE3 bacterium CG08_land_8_20_14_0_20_41_10 TaxID=1975085 RepID=A0A2H0XED8_UNCKA|nr:MAG: hypothetical protein COT50_01530 [candidate division WWE3 bacterium CG08_land_8_20_14_0_20_41_10]